MSEFDKEAEREKLRKRFEKEERKRAASEQMSDLLLKGATMTNRHCETCGNPLFRHDDQVFCPHCSRADTEQDDENQSTQANAQSTQEQAGAAEVAEQQPAASFEQNASAENQAPQPSAQRDAAGDLADARASLVRTVTNLVRRAEQEDDVARARDLLATAREAAETLEAVNDAGQRS